MKTNAWLRDARPVSGKKSIQQRLAESSISKKKQACRFLGIEEPAPQPKLARYAQELDWALADLRSGELTPEIARSRGAFFSRSLAQERTRLAAPMPMARAEMERLEGRLAEFAAEMEGDDKAQLRAAWVFGVESAKGGVSKLGLHGYWMAQALRRDDATELDALWASGGDLGTLKALNAQPMALAISWGARRCAGTIARAGISQLVAMTTMKRAADAMMAQAGAGGIGGNSIWAQALGMATNGVDFFWHSFNDRPAGDDLYLGWVSRRFLLRAAKGGADLDPGSAFGALGQSFTSGIAHGAWSKRADPLMEESEALAAWITLADPKEAAALEAWELDRVAEENAASVSTTSRKLRI